jgi:hypothetical protein
MTSWLCVECEEMNEFFQRIILRQIVLKELLRLSRNLRSKIWSVCKIYTSTSSFQIG